MFAHTLYFNRQWGGEGEGKGRGGLIFVTPWSKIFIVYESWCAEKPLCIVVDADSLKRELLQSLIMTWSSITYIEELLSHLKSFLFCSIFSASKSKRKVERQAQHIFCKGIKLKIRLKIWISHSFKVTFIDCNALWSIKPSHANSFPFVFPN